MSRREYSINLRVNGRQLSKLVIDSHYEVKHSDSVSDETIIELVKKLDGGTFSEEAEDEDGFQYFVEDNMRFEGKHYKLIWLLQEDEIFIGVVNCYRRK